MRVLLPIGLAVLTFALYAGKLSAPFVFDDHIAITNNPSIRTLKLPDAMVAAQATATAGRPLVNLSFALNYAAAKLEPFGYHAVNLAIHFLCSWLVFLCLSRVFAAPLSPERLRAMAPRLAAVAALLFAVHPVAVEIVLYTTQRTEGMVSLFFLLSCYAFLRHASGDGGNGSVALAGLGAFAGAMSKATIVAILPLLVLCDRAFFTGTFAGAWRARRTLYAAVLVSYAPLAFLQSKQPWGYTTGFWDPSYSLAQGRYITGYLTSTVWPQLAFDYGTYDKSLADGAWPYAIAVGCLALLTAVWIFTRPRLGFVGAWVFALLAPTSSIIVIHTEVAADRRIYLPLVALLGALVAAAGAGLSRLAERGAWPVALSRGLAWAASALALSMFFAQTAARTTAFDSEAAFWKRALLETPKNPRASYNLGEAYQRLGRDQDAINAYVVTVYIDPKYARAHTNLGMLLMRHKKTDEALNHMRLAIEYDGGALTHYNYGMALLGMGRAATARAELERAVQLDPDYAEAHANLGILLISQGEGTAGLGHLARAVALNPEPRAVRNYANALAQLGKKAEADAQLERMRQPAR
jgi:Tfp pilus assembly protein PilF